MEPNKILSAPLIDVIFDGRNKAYGAYYLRNTYSSRIKKSLLVTAAITALAFGSAALANSSRKSKPVSINRNDSVILTSVEEHRDKKAPEPERRPTQQKQVRSQAQNTPVIKPDIDVHNQLRQFDDSARVADKNSNGLVDIHTVIEPSQDSVGGGTGIVTPKNDPPEKIETTVQVEAKYIGNWVSFLERNLNAEVPVNNGAPAGRYSVVVQFVVDKEGNVSDLKTLTNHGYGLEQEALRVLRKAPKWQPAIQNGYPVKAYRRQVIVFEVTE